jgi:predicted RNA binding protein YcfA (HicA-like mRNA interferase family)
MRPVTGKELSRILELHGWKLLRVTGSHHIYGRTGSVVRLSVPVHGNKPIKSGLLKHLIKMAGLNDRDLD